MDKAIRKTERDVKKISKELKHLEKEDKKRDRAVIVGKKIMKNKVKK